MCVDCACVPKPGEVCGDGMVVGREDCEASAVCGAGRVCRRCQCANAYDQVVFSDTINDSPLTTQGYGIESVGLVMDGGADDSVIFSFGELNGMQPDMLSEICFVIVVAPEQEQRLCIQKGPGVPRSLTFKDTTGDKRPVLETEAVLSDTGFGFRVRYYPTLGLRPEPALSFYVESLYAGQRTDSLPDVGVLSFREVFGM